MAKKNEPSILKIKIRLQVGALILGPGKMELLARIGDTGSLAAAAKQMTMSYMRAWTLARALNANPQRQLLVVSRGGAGGGRAELTPLGTKVLARYQEMQAATESAARVAARKLARLVS